MAKTLSITIPDAEAAELLTKRSAAEWQAFIKEVVASELRDIRRKAAEVQKPVVTEPDQSKLTTSFS